ncbi:MULTISPECIES: hypothetical protein [Pseudomonadaceae]|uniref:hypothetical protein n=1 Tax=Pseudomonadaceae TaxID=135621 RepID=UPI001112CECD|nr:MULTISPECIES: hypothetical protein [Pseudomonas]QZX85495.1 hypothetical protein K6751_12610 [Pseudomonas otitidis]
MPKVDPAPLDIIGYRGVSLNGIDYRYIFSRGFEQKRDAFTDDPYDMYYISRLDDPSPRSGDMASISANCVSTKISAAALFPNNTDIEWTWIFAVYVAQGFNTYEQQQLDAWEIINRKPEIYGTYLMDRVTWPIHAEEFAAVSIPGRHVLGCVRCQRIWLGNDWKLGGQYILDDTLYWNTANIDTALDADRVGRVKNFIKQEIRTHRVGQLPMTNE